MGTDVEHTAQLLHAIGQAAQAKMPGARPLGRQAHAVVGDGGDDVAGGSRSNGDIHSRGPRVAQGIDQTFLDHPVNRQGDAGPEFSGQFLAQRQGDRRVALLAVPDQALERRRQSQGVERQRRQPRNQAVHGVVEARGLV